jgi:cystathionine beta-synthase
MGLALAAVAKGYRCVFTMADKQSKEKIDILRAVGAEVVVCPTNVTPEDPRSYYSVAKKLNQDIPNSFYPNQYDNLSNSLAHYETTGPEIWRDSEGKITHYAAGVGTGGSMCGTAKFLKEQNPNVITVGIDTYGSVFKKYKETGIFDEKEIYPYLTEGIGEDILPKNVDFSLIDNFIKVTDKDAAVMTRRLAKEEGLFVGWSCGSAVHGALEYAKEHLKEGDRMVIILPDHGTRYLGKVYNDEWMRNHGFLEDKTFSTARDIINLRQNYHLIAASKSDSVREVIGMMNAKSVSQIPVMENGEVVGSLTDTKLLARIVENPTLKDAKVDEVMESSMKFVALDSTLDVLSSMVEKEKAVLVRDHQNQIHLITKHDILVAFTN